MTYEFASLLDGSRWAMRPKAFLAMLRRAEAATPEAIQAAVAAYGSGPTPQMLGDVAVIKATGPIMYQPSWLSMYCGATAIRDLQDQLRASLADPAVKTIAFRWHSPGGSVEMVQEFADELFAARGQKPIVSIADTMIASAAYWIASQSDTIYATTSSRIGAIGVFTEHDDISAMLEKMGIKITLIAHGANKVAGNPYQPLPDDVKASIQEDIDEIGALFDGSVARGRGVTVKAVLDSFGQGDVFSGTQAIKLGLADKKGTISQVIAKLTKGRATTAASARRRAAQIAVPVVFAGKKADDEDVDQDGCEDCSPDCPCENDDCPDDCPTCDTDCACRASAKSKKATAAPPEDAAEFVDEPGLLSGL